MLTEISQTKEATCAGLLARYAGRPALIEADAVISGNDLLSRGGELASRTRGRLRSLLLAADSAADVLTAIAAAEVSGALLVLAPGFTDPAELRELAALNGIDAVLRGASPDALEVVPPKSSAAALGRFQIALMTSGTTGRRKIVRHDLEKLLGRIRTTTSLASRWLLTYSPTGFAGMQVILTALASGATLVASASRDVPELIKTARKHGVTHVSATPTFWRAWLLASGASVASIQQITIGGEAIDQFTLDRLAKAYPSARITHIYASSEAGAVFAVNDRREGFPAAWLTEPIDGTQLRIRYGMLEIRSPRGMAGYISSDQSPFTQDGWLRTGDLVSVVEDRVLFVGRQDKAINVGGYKVTPEEVEAVLLQVPGVLDACVSGKRNPITGNILVAEIVCEPGSVGKSVIDAARQHAAAALPKHKVPATIKAVDHLEFADSGKKQR